METMVVTLGKPDGIGNRPNVIVVRAENTCTHDQVVRYARNTQGGNWRVGVMGDLPGEWQKSNPLPLDGKLMWFLVAVVSDRVGV